MDNATFDKQIKVIKNEVKVRSLEERKFYLSEINIMDTSLYDDYQWNTILLTYAEKLGMSVEEILSAIATMNSISIPTGEELATFYESMEDEKRFSGLLATD